MTQKILDKEILLEKLQLGLGMYEFNATVCGDRPVLKLSLDQAIQIIADTLEEE